MARFQQEDELFGDDLDAVLELLDKDCEEMEADFISETADNQSTSQTFPCMLCNKVCISQRGLTRHTNSKHREKAITSKEANNYEEILHPSLLTNFLKLSCEKLAVDECYPAHIMNEFKGKKFNSTEDVFVCYDLIKATVLSFDGNAEKFYPKFYKVFSDAKDPFNGLSRHCSLLLGFELANHVLAYLAGAKVDNDVVTFEHESNIFMEKDKAIISYLGGYATSTWYRRIRYGKKGMSHHNEYLSFLLACKSDDAIEEAETAPRHKLVNAKNRGGLWNINTDAFDIFSMTESYFQKATETFSSKIDSHFIVASLLQNSLVILNLEKIRSNTQDKVKKEVAFNILEDLLTLYVRVRAHSYAKKRQQEYKIQSGKAKSRSLRTSIKQQSSSLDTGH